MEISSISLTGPTVLQSHLGQQSQLLPGLPSPGLFLSGLGDHSFCSCCGNLILHCVATCHPTQCASAVEQNLSHKGSHLWVPGFHVKIYLWPWCHSCKAAAQMHTKAHSLGCKKSHHRGVTSVEEELRWGRTAPMALVVDGDTTSLGETVRGNEEPGMRWVISGQFRYMQLLHGTGNRLGGSCCVGPRRG